MSTLDVAMLAGLAAAAWFGSSKVCAIMGGCDTQTLAEHDAHRVCRAEAAVTGDGAWRVLRQPARSVAQWRAQFHSDECVLVLPNDDFGATALGAKRSLRAGC